MYFEILLKLYLSESSFCAKLWASFFSVAISFLGQPVLQLESFVPIKRLKIIKEFGDMRKEVAFLFRDMWLNLGRNKKHFVSDEDISLVSAVVRMSLVPVHDIRMATIPIFFDMINFEIANPESQRASKGWTFENFERSLVTALEKYFTEGLGDQNYIELFVQVISSWCLQHGSLMVTGLDFVRRMNILMNLLLELREVSKNNRDEEDQMLSIEKLLNFFETKRLDLYTDYLYKLYSIHICAGNWTEAAYALWEHANRLAWSDRVLDEDHLTNFVRNKYENCRTERDLKEELYEEIIDLLDKGKMWEEAIKCCKEMIQRHFNFTTGIYIRS